MDDGLGQQASRRVPSDKGCKSWTGTLTFLIEKNLVVWMCVFSCSVVSNFATP